MKRYQPMSALTTITTNSQHVSRRVLLQQGGASLAALSFLSSPALAQALRLQPGEEVIPWLDRPAENPVPEIVGNQLEWEDLDSWTTPNDAFFYVAHHGQPEIDARSWRLQLGGMVQRPLALTLDDLKARPREEVDFTIECSGNHGLPFLTGAIGNARWAGTQLAPILEEAGVKQGGIEVVFFGRDTGEVEVRDITMRHNFARSMSLDEAMSPNILLAYEMNGAPLPRANGFPLRLIAPGWYGVANVKWLDRIEVFSKRYMGHYMARDYVTIREDERDGETVWTETSVGRALLKSAPARVSHRDGRYGVTGAAWGGAVARVEVQIDDGPWREAQLSEGKDDPFTWTFWHLDWDEASEGQHSITSRAIDAQGNEQPAMDDPLIAGKHTYWESNGQVTRTVEITNAN
jgi:DMSO/TMAO reductase YedYZ molybdopterin-dependent catalytic subunit